MEGGRGDELVVSPEFQFEIEGRAVVARIQLVNSPQHAGTSLDTTPMQALWPHTV